MCMYCTGMYFTVYVCMPCNGSPSIVLQGELASVCTADSKLSLRPSEGCISSVSLARTRGTSAAGDLIRRTGQETMHYCLVCHQEHAYIQICEVTQVMEPF
jgi:hypothetical protein